VERRKGQLGGMKAMGRVRWDLLTWEDDLVWLESVGERGGGGRL